MTILSEDEFKRCIDNMCVHIAESQPVLMPPMSRGLEAENAALRARIEELEGALVDRMLELEQQLKYLLAP